MAKETTKLLYRITFWKENRDGDPSKPPLVQVFKNEKFYIHANSPSQARTAMQKRFQEAARTSGKEIDFEKAAMFVRDDIQVKIDEIKEYLEPEQLICQNCGSKLDDDYCQECGLRRESWLSLAMQGISKQGKTVADGE